MKTLRIPHAFWCAAAVIAAILLVSLIGNEYYLRIFFLIAVYYLCGLGMNVLVGFAGQKSLGQAGMFAAGAYTVSLLTSAAGVNPWVAFLLAGVVSALFGILIALPSLRVSGPYLAMVTLAFGIVVEKVVTEWTDVFGGPQGLFGVQSLTYQGAPLSSNQMVAVAFILCGIAHLLIRNLLLGRFGRAFRSLQADEIAAASVGINIYGYKIIAFVIAAITCGLAGALVAHQSQYFNSDFINFQLSIFILLIVLFGGSGRIYGPLLGAALLVAIEAVLARWPAVQHLIYGMLLLLALYVMPGGVAGLFVRRRSTRTVEEDEKVVPAPSMATVNRGSGDGKPLLEIAGVSKSFGGVKPAQNVSLSLQPGHIHALIGPNGAGKSTMINMITGILRPNDGAIRMQGQDLVGRSPAAICYAGVSRTFQNLRLFGELSVLENVLVGVHSRMTNGLVSSLLGLPSARREEASARGAAIGILAAVGLSAHQYQRAGDLPYGLQRRVELARALASQPRLLLLDEPAAGLNPQETAELGQLIVQIARSGITVLMVEHHMDLVMSISDHVAVLDYGIKIAEGKPQQVQHNQAVIEAYLGVDSDEPAGSQPARSDHA
jgi:branched-chain amino acid transport system permease protein